MCARNNLPEIRSIHFDRLGNQTDRYKNNIANNNELVNTNGQSDLLNNANPGEIRITPNHAAERFWQIPDREINQIECSFLDENNSIINNLLNFDSLVNNT